MSSPQQPAWTASGSGWHCVLPEIWEMCVSPKLNLSLAFTEGSAQFHSGSCLHLRARGTGLDFSFLLGNESYCTLQKVAHPSPLGTPSSHLSSIPNPQSTSTFPIAPSPRKTTAAGRPTTTEAASFPCSTWPRPWTSVRAMPSARPSWSPTRPPGQVSPWERTS